MPAYAFEEIAQRHGDFAIAAAACELVLDDGGRLEDLSLGLGGVRKPADRDRRAGALSAPRLSRSPLPCAAYAVSHVDSDGGSRR